MSTTQPIRTMEELSRFKNYYTCSTPLAQRNQLLIIMGLNTAFRITDILHLRWNMVYDFTEHHLKSHVEIIEQKTGKHAMVVINAALKEALTRWYKTKRPAPTDFVFESTRGKRPIDRHQAYRIIRKAAAKSDLPDHISCHSLRKTFGYHAWKSGVQPAILMSIYNHSSYRITMRYLCIDQDDKDDVFANIRL